MTLEERLIELAKTLPDDILIEVIDYAEFLRDKKIKKDLKS